MKTTTLSKAAVAFVLALSLAAVPATAEAAPQGTGWTQESFAAAAVKTTGLTYEQAVAAWNDPKRRLQVAVSSTTESVESPAVPATATQRAAVAKESPAFAALGTAALSQKVFSTKRKYFNAVGTELFNLNATKSFLYDGVRVYQDYVTVSAWTNPVGGFYFNSINYSTDQYGAISGIPNSKHISERHGVFMDVFGTYTTVGIIQEGRYNGVTNWSTF